MQNALFSAGHEVRFFFNANPHGDWNNPDTFSDGQLIAIYTTRKNLLSQVGNVGFFVNSAPLTFSADFNFRGETFNFKDLTPSGITVHILASGTVIPSPSTAPFIVQQPFSGIGMQMGWPPSRNAPSPIQNSLKGERDQDR
jgi:hypothetical protein